MLHRFLAAASLALAALPVFGQGDPATIARIVDEGKNDSHVWEYLEHLSHEIGTRLTGSTNLERACEWTRDEFARLGLDARLEPWGETTVRFDRGPSFARMVEPDEREFEFTTRSWGAGTDGPVKGRVFKEPSTLQELEAIENQLEGAWILSAGRSNDRRRGVIPAGDVPEISEQIDERLESAGIAGRIIATRGELVITRGQRGWMEMTEEEKPTEVTMYVRRSDYDAMNSRLADGEEVVVEADLQNNFQFGTFPLSNVVAEIKGTEKPDEVVIVSAHLDTWDGPGSQGAQDNGTGSSVTLEAARILSEVGVKPKRTIRFILWTGEEQGLLGSEAYVENLSEEEKAKISLCLVDDGGTNYEGGLVCIEEMAPMLREATAPVNEAFPDMPVEIIVRERMPRGGGSDHVSFNRAGIPGFFWEEKGSGGREGKNYGFIHHTQHDTTRYAVPEYLVQSGTCAAITAYNLAMADTLLPRQPEEPAEEDLAEADAEPAPSSQKVPADSPILGTWHATRVSGDGEKVPFTFTLARAEDGTATGRLSSERGDADLAGITFDPDTGELAFVLPAGYADIRYQATVKGDLMTGSLSVMQVTREWTAERAKGATETSEPVRSGGAG